MKTPERSSLRGFLFHYGGLSQGSGVALPPLIEPFADVVCDYTCHDRAEKRYADCHEHAPPPIARFR